MAANVADFLEVVQDDARLRLKSDPVFAGLVPVFSMRRGNTESEILNSLSVLNSEGGGKVGACITVLMPDFDNAEPASDAPIGDLVLTVRVLEAPVFNLDEATGTQLSAERIALRALRVLCFLCEQTGTQLRAKGEAIKPFGDLLEQGILGYDVTVRGRAGIKAGDKLRVCTVGGSAAAVTLANDDGAATIWYTTDGSYPGSGNPAATEYTGTFSVTSPTMLRVAAEHPDKVGSDPIQFLAE